jgi:hypothetical protein
LVQLPHGFVGVIEATDFGIRGSETFPGRQQKALLLRPQGRQDDYGLLTGHHGVFKPTSQSVLHSRSLKRLTKPVEKLRAFRDQGAKTLQADPTSKSCMLSDVPLKVRVETAHGPNPI